MMNIDINILLFCVFLVFNMSVALFYSRGVMNLNVYALGGRNFSTSTLVATIVASWLGAGFFNYNITETYRQGLVFLIPASLDSIGMLMIGYLCAHRMGEFLGEMSIASSMNSLFGRGPSVITALMSLFLSTGYLAMQFKVSSKILELVFGTSGIYVTFASSIIVILYSAFGGIRSVTFTDIIQFFTFACILPFLALVIYDAIIDRTQVADVLFSNELFSFAKLFDFSNPKLYEMLGLCFVFFPEFAPAIFQRIAMAKDTKQVAKSFKIAGFVCFAMWIIVVAIGVFLLAANPNLDPNNLLSHIVERYATVPGFKGMIAIGIMAMIMSTADSLINSAAIIFTHDLCVPFGFKYQDKQIIICRIFALVLGGFAMLLALRFESLLDIVVLVAGAYGSVICVPIWFAIFGFRSSGMVTLLSMLVGGLTFFLFEKGILNSVEIFSVSVQSVVPGIFSNFVALFSLHYILRAPGGWVGVKDKISFYEDRQDAANKRNGFIYGLYNFSFVKFFRLDYLKGQSLYHCIGFISAISVIIGMCTIEQSSQNAPILLFIFKTGLFFSTCFVFCTFLPEVNFKYRGIVSVLWIIGLTYLCVFMPVALLIASNFSMIQSMLCMLNIILLLQLLRWWVGLSLFALGFISIVVFVQTAWIDTTGILENKLYYFLLPSLAVLSILSSILTVFFTPMLSGYVRNDFFFSDMQNNLPDFSETMAKFFSVKQQVLKNMNQDIKVPMNSIATGAFSIYHDWDKYTDQEKKEMAYSIYSGYQAAKVHINNVVDLAQINNDHTLHCKMDKIDFISFVENILDSFKESMPKNAQVNITYTKLFDRQLVRFDQLKMERMILNLLENALSPTLQSDIHISIEKIVRNQSSWIQVTVQDNGAGFSDEELVDIFEPILPSPSAGEKAGRVGIDLAICKLIVNLHGGVIWAENNFNTSGATLSFIIPINN